MQQERKTLLPVPHYIKGADPIIGVMSLSYHVVSVKRIHQKNDIVLRTMFLDKITFFTETS